MQPEEPLLEIDVRQEDGRAVLAPRGELDIGTVPALRERIDEALAGGCGELVLDLRELTFIDSTGVRLLVRVHGAASEGGPAFAIVDGPPAVMRVLELTGVSDFIPRAELE